VRPVLESLEDRLCPSGVHLLVGSYNTHGVLRYDGNTGAHVDTFVPRQSGGLREPHGVLFGPHHNRHVRKAMDPVVASRFVLTGPSAVISGHGFELTVTAEDAAGKVATDYRGTVHFSVPFPLGASLPGDYTFTAADQGSHQFFNLVVRARLDGRITVTDTQNPALTGSISVIVLTNPPGCC
jgi:hypothetical protein